MKSSHLTPGQRNLIRYKLRMTEAGIARKFGISVAEVRAVRASAQPNHPARLAALVRHDPRAKLQAVELVDTAGQVVSRTDVPKDIPAFDVDKITSGTVERREVPATSTEPPLGQLRVEGGADLPAVLE